MGTEEKNNTVFTINGQEIGKTASTFKTEKYNDYKPVEYSVNLNLSKRGFRSLYIRCFGLRHYITTKIL